MQVTSGEYMTRSGLPAYVLVGDDGRVSGFIFGSPYPKEQTRWFGDGVHILSRCDDLLCTWDEHITRSTPNYPQGDRPRDAWHKSKITEPAHKRFKPY